MDRGYQPMTITLTPETEARLRQRAAGEGQDFDRVADTLLQIALDWEEQDRAVTVEVLQRSLAASDAGRVRPFTQFAEEMRAKYDLPTHLSDQELGTEVITR
jgi:hypothetical protein